MHILVTGASGFVGQHLIRYLAQTQPEATLYGTTYRTPPDRLLPDVHYTALNLVERDAVRDLLDAVQPDAIYHLAAQASARRSFAQPWETLEANIKSQFNLIEGCLSLGIEPRLLIVSSAEIYDTAPPTEMPISETCPFLPKNPYSLSKITQDMMGLQYFLTHEFPIIRARAFNHTGPGQREIFVAPDFALQIARIEQGLQPPLMHVGNLSAQRDFTDVRDVVRAYHLLMKHGSVGKAYNVASNKAFSIQYLLDTLLSHTETSIDVQVDPAKLRPVDVPLVQGDNQRLREVTGWQPEISFEQMLHDLLEDCRQRVQSTI